MREGLKIQHALPGGFTSVELLQQFNNGQIRRMGVNVNLSVGSNVIPIQLPGLTKMLLGINFYDTTLDPSNIATLNINGDERVKEVAIVNLSRLAQNAGIYTGNEFFKIYCPLSGNDTITLTVMANTGGALLGCVYYVNSPVK